MFQKRRAPLKRPLDRGGAFPVSPHMPAVGVTIHDCLGVSSVADLLQQVFTKDNKRGLSSSVHFIWFETTSPSNSDRRPPTSPALSTGRTLSLRSHIGTGLWLETWAPPHTQMATGGSRISAMNELPCGARERKEQALMRVYIKTNYTHSAEGKGSRHLKGDASKSCAQLPAFEQWQFI